MGNYHKMQNVPVAVCVGEQKVAYNLAVWAFAHYVDAYNEAETEEAKKRVLSKAVDEEFVKYLKIHGGEYYDNEIKAILVNGIEGFFADPFLAGNYEEVGRSFPIPA